MPSSFWTKLVECKCKVALSRGCNLAVNVELFHLKYFKEAYDIPVTH